MTRNQMTQSTGEDRAVQTSGRDAGGTSRDHPLERVQRQHGNRTVQRMLAEASASVGGSEASTSGPGPAVQRRCNGPSPDRIKQAASEGISQSSGGQLPHLNTIQCSFGSYDVSGIEAHTGPAVQRSARAMNAEAYATGNHVAFADSSPDLHTAAHEAAHVVQQRAGAMPENGVGRPGDRYERHADRVARKVVQGKSAEDTLDRMAGQAGNAASQSSTQRMPVQRTVGFEFQTRWNVAKVVDAQNPDTVEKKLADKRTPKNISKDVAGYDADTDWDKATRVLRGDTFDVTLDENTGTGKSASFDFDLEFVTDVFEERDDLSPAEQETHIRKQLATLQETATALTRAVGGRESGAFRLEHVVNAVDGLEFVNSGDRTGTFVIARNEQDGDRESRPQFVKAGPQVTASISLDKIKRFLQKSGSETRAQNKASKLEKVAPDVGTQSLSVGGSQTTLGQYPRFQGLVENVLMILHRSQTTDVNHAKQLAEPLLPKTGLGHMFQNVVEADVRNAFGANPDQLVETVRSAYRTAYGDAITEGTELHEGVTVGQWLRGIADGTDSFHETLSMDPSQKMKHKTTGDKPIFEYRGMEGEKLEHSLKPTGTKQTPHSVWLDWAAFMYRTITQLNRGDEFTNARPMAVPMSKQEKNTAKAQGGHRSLLPVQRASTAGSPGPDRIKQAAREGINGSSGGQLPHLNTIQRSFGSYDVSGVEAHTGPAVQRSARKMNAKAYATGNDVAFADSSPDLHTAAHEAAHVVQQRTGAIPEDGVGRPGDKYEQHADRVARKVMQSKSAESTLDEMAGDGAAKGHQRTQRMTVQRVPNDRGQYVPEVQAGPSCWLAALIPVLEARGYDMTGARVLLRHYPDEESDDVADELRTAQRRMAQVLSRVVRSANSSKTVTSDALQEILEDRGTGLPPDLYASVQSDPGRVDVSRFKLLLGKALVVAQRFIDMPEKARRLARQRNFEGLEDFIDKREFLALGGGTISTEDIDNSDEFATATPLVAAVDELPLPSERELQDRGLLEAGQSLDLDTHPQVVGNLKAGRGQGRGVRYPSRPGVSAQLDLTEFDEIRYLALDSGHALVVNTRAADDETPQPDDPAETPILLSDPNDPDVEILAKMKHVSKMQTGTMALSPELVDDDWATLHESLRGDLQPPFGQDFSQFGPEVAGILRDFGFQ